MDQFLTPLSYSKGVGVLFLILSMGDNTSYKNFEYIKHNIDVRLYHFDLPLIYHK